MIRDNNEKDKIGERERERERKKEKERVVGAGTGNVGEVPYSTILLCPTSQFFFVFTRLT